MSASFLPQEDAVRSVAIEVFETEMAGMRDLVTSLSEPGAPLSKAMRESVNLCGNVRGRVIVTGMGKSGHVARKIAATLASTGTKASYVHPAEASHGDLGMISSDDVVLALSNSGETAELGDILGYAGRFGIPLIAMTANAESTLARAGDVQLIIPRSAEACLVTQAPTTSTTLMMALGDALAVAILRARGFTADDFHTFHPGGKLGASLKRVTDLMHHTDMPLCGPEASVEDAVSIITTSGFGCVGVVEEDGRLTGMVTDGDLRRHFNEPLDEKSVTSVMTENPRTVPHDALAAEALSMMSSHRITALFIVDDAGKPLGLLHVHDCLDSGVI
ncbi:MAG: KpsF/GutQ family sugar-phosphate isomerase [Henriciella sp.]|uniref:KpsF/GutQ family sugar-phosphate isomerase n=1 Tax=Henriciella sp. TaxID=1968823 RepID=UPI0026044D56|nr:KpsF/GutQ family sugar-phosphate isomerase [Henriciella sp.]